MNKIVFPVIFLLMVSISSFGQKQTRNVSSFTGISVGVAANVYITTGGSHKVVLEGDEDILDRIETSVKNDRLVIKSRNNSWWKNSRDKVTIYISVKEIEYLSLGGSGKIFSENTINADRLRLTVSGSGDMQLDINVRELDQGISGSGDIELKGRAQDVGTTISGSGSLKAEELVADNYEVRISGSGKCRIHAKKEIDARVSGSGSIYYKGDPNIRSNISGSGKIRTL